MNFSIVVARAVKNKERFSAQIRCLRCKGRICLQQKCNDTYIISNWTRHERHCDRKPQSTLDGFTPDDLSELPEDKDSLSHDRFAKC